MSDFCDPMDRSLPGSSVHGLSQARYLSGLPFPSPFTEYLLCVFIIELFLFHRKRPGICLLGACDLIGKPLGEESKEGKQSTARRASNFVA